MKRRSIPARTATTVTAMGAVAALALGAGPASASIGTRVTVTVTCTTVPTLSTSTAPDGQVRGFIETGCGNDVISYVTNHVSPGGWATKPTPYRGMVLASAQDAQNTYLLYRASDGVRVTKVTRAGVFTKGNLLSKAAGGGLEGTIAARGGLWVAVWTEPKAGGGFALHQAGSWNYVVSPKDRLLPAGAGVDDSAPSLSPAAFGSGYLLAFSRHTASGYHLMLAHGYPRTFAAKQLDTSTENPQASVFRSGKYTYVAWVHNTSIRLATTVGHAGTVVPLYQVPVPQPPVALPASNPRLAVGCGRLFVGYQADTETTGHLYVNTRLNGHWVQHPVANDSTAAPVLGGIAAHCAAGAVLWSSASHIYGVMVA